MEGRLAAIGFDLFNTLITVEPKALSQAMENLIGALREAGFIVGEESFKQAHREAAIQFFKQCRRDGRETHNRFWISAALQTLGYCDVEPDDPKISMAVDAYFSAFLPHCHLIPGTLEMLKEASKRFRVGLLSNFTHGPAARAIIREVGLEGRFDAVVISGEVGYRKPHPYPFGRLIEGLGVNGPHEVAFVGDDPEADVLGALRAGLRPIWTTCVMDHNIPTATTAIPPREDIPMERVQRISKWEDLLSILESQPD